MDQDDQNVLKQSTLFKLLNLMELKRNPIRQSYDNYLHMRS